MNPYAHTDDPEPRTHQYDPSKASTSQFSFYDDDITDIEKSVLGHITNAAFTHENFYNDERNNVDREYYRKPPPTTTFKPWQSPNSDINDEYSYDEDDNDYRNPPPVSNQPKPKYNSKSYYSERNQDRRKKNKPRSYHTPNYYKYYKSNYPDSQRNNDYNQKNMYVEDVPTRPELIYPLNSGYHYPDDDEYYDEKPESEPSVIENLKNNLPWPLNMVGRMGRDSNSNNEEVDSIQVTKYPDSIQSILKNIDQSETKPHNQYVQDQSEYPFLDEEDRHQNNNNEYSPYEEPQYNSYGKEAFHNLV